jgi:phosphatidylserine decarboxylase
MTIARDGWAYVAGGLLAAAGGAAMVALTGHFVLAAGVLGGGVVLAAGFAFFFRDPERVTPAGENVVVSGADGWVRSVEEFDEPRFLGTRAVRISTFLSVFDVHINRAPMGGRVAQVEYTPGRKVFAFLDEASEVNEHSSILIRGERAACLVKQIVGPVARRVVTWVRSGDAVAGGSRIGLMKFGSRLDVYLPADRAEVLVHKGQKVRAGETVIARWRGESAT